MVIWGRHRGGNEPDLLEFGLMLNLGSYNQPLGWFSRGIPLIGEEMPYGKGPIKTGKLIPGKPGKRKPVQPVRPEPKNEGRMYAGGDPNFNERTGKYKIKNLVGNKEVRNNKQFKARVQKTVKAQIVNPSLKKKPVQPKRPGGR